MKKLVFTHLYNDFSGSPKVLSQVIRACQELGYVETVYSGGNTKGFLSNVSARYFPFYYRRSDVKIITLFFFFISQIDLILKLFRYRNSDVIFYVNTMLPFGAAVAGKLLGKPVLYHIHESSVKPELLKLCLRHIIEKCATRVIYVSHTLQKAESFPDIPSSVIHNSLPRNFTEVAFQHNYRWKVRGKFTVLMVCSLKKYKGIDEFIRVADLCISRRDISFTLVLNENIQNIDRYFANLDAPQNLTIHPATDDVIPFYQEASLLVNLTRIDLCIETFGLTIIEAMAFGIPTIAPPVGGPAELVTNGVEGYLISSHEVDKISMKIRTLASSYALTQTLSENARVRSRCFLQSTFDDQIAEILDN